jgi:hypothetical protein
LTFEYVDFAVQTSSARRAKLVGLVDFDVLDLARAVVLRAAAAYNDEIGRGHV